MEITQTDKNRDYWCSREYLTEPLKASAKKADILIVPLENFREGIDVVFYQGTTDLFKYLNDHLPSSTSLELCSEDENYLEIALHSREFRLGHILAASVAVPLLINLLSSYVYDNLKAKSDDNISISLSIEVDQCQTYKVHYDGSAENFKSLKDQVDNILDKCKTNDAAH